MRNWYYFTWLSGDHIVEQAVHSIDKMCWAMNGELPVRAVAVGGRQVRTGPEFGHIFDHFSVTYDYASGVKGFHMCRQQAACAIEGPDYILGTKGNCEIEASRRVHVIRGERGWRYSGPHNNMYQSEHDELFASIRRGEPINDGTWMTHSTMMAILGRMAAYTGQVISWEQALNSQEDLSPPKLDWNLSLKEPPIALPGLTRFT
jgi:predicted dehydrogenase